MRLKTENIQALKVISVHRRSERP